MEVVVAGKSIRVVELSQEDIGENLLGQFRSEPVLEIRLLEGMKKAQRIRTIRHEMFHALLYLTGLSSQLTYDQNESVTMALENYAEDIIKESRKV